MNDTIERDPRLYAIPDVHGHAKGEHKPYLEERPLPLTARMLFLWFYHACRRGFPRFLMVADHMNYLTFEDPAAVNLVRRALKLAQAGDLYGAAETANVDVAHAAVVSEGLRRGMRYAIGAEVDNDPRSRPDAQNIVDAMRPDGVIRSVHFIPVTHPVHGENWLWPFDNPEFADVVETVGIETMWETYVNLLVDAIERLPGHIVGHFFVPAVLGWPSDEKLSGYEDRVLAAAGERGMAVEFNTRFLYRDHSDEEKDRYLEANKRFLRKAKERGVGIAVGADAHSPRDQANGFEIVLAILDQLEINELVFPLGGALRRVALRVVREPEPEPVAPAPAPERVRVPTVRSDDADASTGEPAPKPARKPRPAGKPAGPQTIAAVDEPAAPASATATAAQVAETPPSQAAPPAAPPPRVRKPRPPSKPAPGPGAAAAAPLPAKSALPPPAPSARKPIAKVTPPAKVVALAAKAATVKKPAAKPAAVKAAPAKAAAHAKPAPAKAAARKPAPAAKKAAPAKAAVKAKPAKPSSKKAAASKPAAKKKLVRPAVKKAAPAKKAASKKAAPHKKAASIRPAAKKTSTAKKVAAKKSAPARNAPARKPAAAKKSTKKTAAKRR